MRILVTGAGGQLGYDVCRELAARGIEYRGVDRGDFDITDTNDTRVYTREFLPNAVIHCAAYTKVDQAEQEPQKCRAVNEIGTENIVLACREVGAKILYVSTDYVFNGSGTEFYETDTPPFPLNVYGRSKLVGEQIVQKQLGMFFIVRTSWMFGIHGRNFVKSILSKAEKEAELKVVGDQFGSPTYTRDLAGLLCNLVETEKYGIYHAVGDGVCSWAEFARETLLLAEKPVKVTEITSKEYLSPAKRPRNSRMSTESITKAGFQKLPPWQDALQRYLKEEGVDQ